MECPICRTEPKEPWLEHIKTKGHQNLLKTRIEVEEAQPIGERHGIRLDSKGITRFFDKEVSDGR